MEEHKSSKPEVKEGVPFAVLSYILCLWILTFIFKKDNQFALFHARQGIVIFVGNIICFAFMFIPVLGVLFSILQFVLVITSLYGIYLSLTGKTEPIYLIGDIVKRLVV